MNVLISINESLKRFVYRYIVLFIIIFSILSLTSITSFWWLSLFSIVFFIWNIFNKRKYLGVCITFLSISISFIVFNFLVIQPAIVMADKFQEDWNKTGYDKSFLANSQETLNVIARSIEENKKKYGKYPNKISDIRDIFINNEDLSFRIKYPNGKIRGIAFYYEKIDSNKFFLAGVGQDGVIKTKDDLLPQISSEQEKATGLLKYVIKSFSNEEIEREQNVIKMCKQVKDLEKQEKKVDLRK